MNKKLMSSVLAGAMAVSALGVSASAATATTKNVSAAGSTTFKVSATVAEAIIDVTIPSSMSAVVNPYGISVTTKTGVYGATGFTSPVYTIKNNTLTSAVMVSATPTITVPTITNPDKSKSPAIAVVGTAADIATNETAKTKAIYAYVAGIESATTVSADADPAALTIFDATGAPASGVTVAVFEDATGDVKGATHTKSDLLLIPKGTAAVAEVPESSAGAGDGTPAVPAKYGYGQLQMGGDVTNTNITPWTKSDKISVNLVLDIAPCKDDATKGTYAGGGDDNSSTVTPGLTADLTQADFTGTGITAFAKGANANEYDMTVNSTTNGGSAINLNLTGLVDNAQTITTKVADNSNVTVGGLGMNVTITPAAATGNSVVTITLSDSNTIVINIAIEA